VDFTPSQDKILFGLSAVRNIGQRSDRILDGRNTGGESLNRWLIYAIALIFALSITCALETLIHCGAFDIFSQPEPVNSRPRLE